MHSSPDTKEKFSSQIPASKLLHQIGYTYLTPGEANAERKNTSKNVLLYDLLAETLKKLPCNQIELDGKLVAPPSDLIKNAIKHIDNPSVENLINDNKELYKKLVHGETFKGTIEGKEVSKHIRYIDFSANGLKKNEFHFTEEYSVLRTGIDKDYRPDIVCFINGIPVVVIENKRRGKGQIYKGVEDHLKKQKDDGIKDLYVYSQILLSMCGNKALYGALGAGIKFWKNWKEDEDNGKKELPELEKLIQTEPGEVFKEKLFSWRNDGDLGEMEKQWNNIIAATEQDKLIYFMLRKDRLLKELSSYILYEGDTKILARHYQYFGVEKALTKISNIKNDGAREGGLFWHTTGSGKSLTMVMLAKGIFESGLFEDPRIVLVTDRVQLDSNVFDAFYDCDLNIKKIKRGQGEQTSKLINDRDYKVISTVIDRLEKPLKKFNALDDSTETFIFVDEAHRTQSETSHKRATMKAIFPNASIIGFTGTPIKKTGNNTVKLFDGWIHKHTMDDALAEGDVAKIIYSNRHCPLNGDDKSLERWFEIKTEDLSKDAKTKLRKAFKSQDEVLKSSTRRAEIAYNIATHFKDNYRVPNNKVGLKGMFATSSKYEALKYTELLEENGISVNLVISDSTNSEGEVTLRKSEKEEIKKFWSEIIETKYGGETKYNEHVLTAFKKKREPEIIVVVDKLLTGFNNPRAAVLYTDKKLKEHKVLQAIARVNRIFSGKEYGEVVDYRNIIGEVTSAIEFYRKLEDEGYEPDEIKGALFDIENEIGDLDDLLEKIWGCFPEDSDTFKRGDQTLMVAHLLTKETYSAFMIALKKFHYKYKIARGYYKWVKKTPQEKQEKIKADFKYFIAIRAEAEDDLGGNDNITYADLVDDIRKFVEEKISAEPPEVKLDKVEIFSKDYEERNKKKKSKRSQADSIHIRLKNYFEEHWDDDPILAKKISDIINETYQDFHKQLIDDIEYFNKMDKYFRDAKEGNIFVYPDGIGGEPELVAYYNIFKDEGVSLSDTEFLKLVIKIQMIISIEKKIDWVRKNIIENMEKELFDKVIWNPDFNLNLGDKDDHVVSEIINRAKRYQGR